MTTTPHRRRRPAGGRPQQLLQASPAPAPTPATVALPDGPLSPMFGHPITRRIRLLVAPIVRWSMIGAAGVVAAAIGAVVHLAPTTAAVAVGILAVWFAAAGVCGVCAVPRHVHHTATLYWSLGAALAAGGWILAGLFGAVWHPITWAVWAGLLAVDAGSWWTVRHIQVQHEIDLRDDRADRDTTSFDPDAGDEDAQQKAAWAQVFATAGAPGLRCDKIGAYRGGIVLEFTTPPDGSVTYRGLLGIMDTLEEVIGHRIKGGMREGAVRIRRPVNAAGRPLTGKVLVYLDLLDVLAKSIPMPEDHRPLSIYDAFTVGVYQDGSPIQLSMYQIHTLVAGQTRMGKSNFLHVLLSLLTRCVDVVVWMYDGKGGATVYPWVGPYLKRKIDPVTNEPDLAWPVIDWVAVDRLEAERMMLGAVALAKARPGIRRSDEHAEANAGDKWRASARYPAVFVIIDEASEMMGSHTGPTLSSAVAGASSGELANIWTQVAILGAGEGVQIVVSAQRATVGMLGNGNAKSQIGLQVCVPLGGGRAEATEVFGSDLAASLLAANLTHPGSVVVSGRGMPDAQDGKIYRIAENDDALIDTITRAVYAHTPLCGELDEPSEKVLEPVGYQQRWTDPDRTYWTRNEPMPATLRRYHPNPVPATPAAQTPRGSTVEALGLTGVPDAFAAPVDPPATGPEQVPTSPDDPTWTAFERAHPELDDVRKWNAGVGPEPAPAEPEPTGGYDLFLKLVQDAGIGGITVPQIMEALRRRIGPAAPKAPTTVYRWKDKAVTAGLLMPSQSTGGRAYRELLVTTENWRNAGKAA